MNDAVRGWVLLLLLAGVFADCLFSWDARMRAAKLHDDTMALAKEVKDEAAATKKRLGHLEYVNRRAEEYERVRKAGRSAAEAAKKAAEVKP